MQYTELEMLYQKHLVPFIRQVERELVDCPVHPALQEMYVQAVSGGKRFRASLCLLGFVVCGGDNLRSIIPAAMSLELLHKASLVHDDLVDGDRLRRGRPAFHALYGEAKAVVLGDLLVAMGYKALRALEVPPHVLQPVREAFETAHFQLCQGELLELATAGCIDAFSHSSDIVYGKTACLIEKSLEIGGILAQGQPAHIEAVAKYGRIMGTCFQIINDMNNLTDLDHEVKGRSCGDLDDAKISYPLSVVKDMLEEGEFKSLWEALTGEDLLLRKGAVKRFGELMVSPEISGIIHRKVSELRDQARECLDALPMGKGRLILQTVGEEIFEEWFWRGDGHGEAKQQY